MILISYFWVAFNDICLLLTSRGLIFRVTTTTTAIINFIICTTPYHYFLLWFKNRSITIWFIICLLQKVNMNSKILIWHPDEGVESIIYITWDKYIITILLLQYQRFNENRSVIFTPCELELQAFWVHIVGNVVFIIKE